MKKKKTAKLIGIFSIFLLLTGGILLYIFDISKIVTVSFDTNGGNIINNIKTKKGKTIRLPNNPTNKDNIFVGWENENGYIVEEKITINKNTKIKAIWIGKDVKTITISFDTDGGNKIKNIIIEKGKKVLLPAKPIKENNVFLGWIDDKGNIIQKGIITNEDLKLKALWIEESKEIRTISFDTDGGEKIKDIIIEKGKTINLPPNPTKKEYSFSGWINEKNEKVTKETIISLDTKLKAIWTGPYICPDKCIQNDDGKYCTKIKSPIISYTCPSGYTLLEGQCLKLSTKYNISKSSNDVDLKCKNETDGKYTEELNHNSIIYCAEKIDVISKSTCQKGYTLEGDICRNNTVSNCKLKDVK